MFLFLLCITFISATSMAQRQDAEVDESYIISQPCATCTYMNISVLNQNRVVLNNVAMVNNGSTWTYTFTPNETIRHDVNGIGDINTQDDSFAFYFLVSPINVAATIAMLLIFSMIIVGIAVLHHRVNFEKWHDKLLNSDKTFIKSAMASVPYTFMKSSYMAFYLLGFPIIFLITDLIFFFNLTSISYMFEIFSKIYTVGLVFPGLFLLGDMVKVIIDLWDSFQDKNWGITG